MNAVGGILVALVALATTVHAAPAVAGWTADGKAVITDLEDKPVACTPMAFDANGNIPDAVCAPCGADARACGVTGVKPKPSSTSPDKSLTVERSESCHMTGHDMDMKVCAQFVQIGRLGRVSHDDEITGGGVRARVTTVFRPDGGALAVVFGGGSRGDEVAIVDLSDHLARGAVPVKAKELLAAQASVLAGTSTAPVYTADAVFFTDDASRGALAPGELAKLVAAVTLDKTEIETSFDGHAAWASFVATTADKRAYRVTELLVRDGATWRVAGGMWTIGTPDADAAAQASAKTLPAQTEVARMRQDVPDELSALGAMLRDGDPELLAKFSTRKRAMLVGTAPAERFVGGTLLARAWKPFFAAGIRGAKVRGALGPRGTSGWLVTNVKVSQGKAAARYELPWRVWAVVDRDDEGQLELVVLHAAVTR